MFCKLKQNRISDDDDDNDDDDDDDVIAVWHNK